MSSYAQSIFIYGSNHSTNTIQQSNIAMYHLIRTVLRRKCLMSQWTIPFSNNFIIFFNLILATMELFEQEYFTEQYIILTRTEEGHEKD